MERYGTPITGLIINGVTGVILPRFQWSYGPLLITGRGPPCHKHGRYEMTHLYIYFGKPTQSALAYGVGNKEMTRLSKICLLETCIIFHQVYNKGFSNNPGSGKWSLWRLYNLIFETPIFHFHDYGRKSKQLSTNIAPENGGFQ